MGRKKYEWLSGTGVGKTLTTQEHRRIWGGERIIVYLDSSGIYTIYVLSKTLITEY